MRLFSLLTIVLVHVALIQADPPTPPDQLDWTAAGSYTAFGTVTYYLTYPFYLQVSSYNITLVVDTGNKVIAFITDDYTGGAQWVTSTGYYFVFNGTLPNCVHKEEGTYDSWVKAYKQALFTHRATIPHLPFPVVNNYGGLVADPSSCGSSLAFLGSQTPDGKVANYNVHSYLWQGVCGAGEETKVFQKIEFQSFGPPPTPTQIALPTLCNSNLGDYCATYYPPCQPTLIPFPVNLV